MYSADYLQAKLEQLTAWRHLCIAYSGGMDSHVLLHSAAMLQARNPSFHVSAVHVHHGLHPDAAKWADHCRQVCAALGVPLQIQSVNIDTQQGRLSLEEAARAARYQALAKVLAPKTVLLLAHTQNDQAETVLLQLLRGAGPKGLAAMPVMTDFAQGQLIRPLLTITRQDLTTYAQQHQLSWCEDPSNINLRFDRNYLRHKILPPLLQRWPGALTTLSRTAIHCAEAASLLTELAIADEKLAKGEEAHSLSVNALLKLPAARQRNLIREWLMQLKLPLPPQTKLNAILHDVLLAAKDSNPLVTWGNVVVRRYRDELFAEIMPATLSKNIEIDWPDLSEPLVLPDGLGTLIAKSNLGMGMRLPIGATVSIRFRRGGERIQLPGRNGHHQLKKLLQEWGVPPWQRERLPLVYINGALAAVVGQSIAAEFVAQKDEVGVIIQRVEPDGSSMPSSSD